MIGDDGMTGCGKGSLHGRQRQVVIEGRGHRVSMVDFAMTLDSSDARLQRRLSRCLIDLCCSTFHRPSQGSLLYVSPALARIPGPLRDPREIARIAPIARGGAMYHEMGATGDSRRT